VADASVRPARASEAAEIARIQRDTLAMTYEEALTPGLMAQLGDPQLLAAAEAQIAAQVDAGSAHVLVALEGERIVGFAFAHPGIVDGESMLEAADVDAEHTAVIAQLLVEPRWGRRGHGSRLLAAATDVLSADGFTRVVTWVPENSVSGTAFLASAGWASDGYARGLDNGNGVIIRELRFHAALGPAD
jgi:GNAT superfamily N-acetyltransferase